MFIELHIIQNFAPSNLNRDDTGNPKEAEFGGVRRARISSQSLKRSIRLEPSFAESTGADQGMRTRWLARLVYDDLIDKGGKDEKEAETVSIAFATAYLGDMDKKKPLRSSVLLYLSVEERSTIFDAVLTNWDSLLQNDKKKITQLANSLAGKLGEATSAPDIALFGRMLARKPTTIKLDAASQVAHALSTHRVNMELDFFTAVDQWLEQQQEVDSEEDKESGAGMMGVTGFNSPCFYRYARIDWGQLVKNLDGDVELAQRTVAAFLTASLRAIPTGKQNSHAAQNPPGFALAVTRTDGASWNLVNAFEKPVRPDREGGYVAPSVSALDAYWERLGRFYGKENVTPHVLNVEEVPLNALKTAQLQSISQWTASVIAALPSQ